jgi:hypothetical protein
MSIAAECPKCGKAYKVKDELAGKAIRCRECQATIRIPAADADDDNLDFDGSEMEADEPAELPPSRSTKPSHKSAAKGKSKASGNNAALKWVLGIAGGFLALCLLCCGGVFFAGARFWGQLSSGVEVPAGQTFDQWRTGFKTKLLKTGPSEQEYDPTEQPPENVTEVMYPSGPLNLKAWVHRPPGVEEPRPALVFFHGGFAFGGGDLEACQPFMDAGFVVMAPMLRGENGNPGNYELFFGEIDDARAACQWLSKQPYVKGDRIYTFGHSVGGGVSAVLSLLDNVPIRHGGSSGGLYEHLTFMGWNLEGMVPFENTPQERSVRLLLGNTAHMQHPHFAFVGDDDGYDEAAESVRKEPNGGGKLTLEKMPGDHFDSFEPALQRYLEIVLKDGM